MTSGRCSTPGAGFLRNVCAIEVLVDSDGVTATSWRSLLEPLIGQDPPGRYDARLRACGTRAVDDC